MRRYVPLVLLLVLPLTVLALDYADATRQYADAPFSQAETAAISVLTHLGIVQGNPDGTFAPARTLNRAEFLKIALRAQGSISVTPSDAARCFPDVQKTDWFSPYVCLAKMRKVVEGYPDGKFHPERMVNYAEAVKMLDVTFGIPLPQYVKTPDHWYDPYLDGAYSLGVQLSGIVPASAITRGQMARLAAAFIAQSKGELGAYRAAEQGRLPSSSSTSSSAFSSRAVSSVRSSNSSSSVSSVPSVSSSSTSSASSASSAFSSTGLDLPARSHFLVLGTLTDPIASATFTSSLEPVTIRSIKVKMKTKVRSFNKLEVVDRDGVRVGLLSLDLNDTYEITWKASFDSGAYLLPKDVEKTLAIRALMKDRDSGGSSEQLVQVDTFTIVVQGIWSSNTYSSAPQSFTFPRHQTAQARVTTIKNVLPAQGVLPVGLHQVVAAFAFSGTVAPTVALRFENLSFFVAKSASIAVSNWSIVRADGGDAYPCSVSEGMVNCMGIPEGIGTVGSQPLVLRLIGDVAVDQGAQYPSLEVDVSSPGSIDEIGAVQWTDGVGHFHWVEASSVPVAAGTRWQG